MALSRSEQISLYSTITFSGASAVGKDELSAWVALGLGKFRIVTGDVYRSFGWVGLRQGLFESGQEGQMRLIGRGVKEMLGLFARGITRLGYLPDERRNRLAQFHLDGRNMTAVIRPRRRGFANQMKLEAAAAAVAIVPDIRHEVDSLLRKTAIAFGGPVMVAKNVDDFVPEAHRKYVLVVTDPRVSAGYRMIRRACATGSYEDELAWLKARDALHEANGLERLPRGAQVVDMTKLLERRDGMAIAASVIMHDLSQIREHRLTPHCGDALL